MAAYCLPTHLVLTQSRMRPWATPPTRERRFLCTAARPGTQGSRTDGWGEIDGLVPRVNTRAARAVAQWARGRDFAAMLRGLSDFPQLVSAAPAAPSSGDAKQIRRSYHAACKQLHPDRHVASGATQQALASELFKVLSAAYVEAFHGQRV